MFREACAGSPVSTHSRAKAAAQAIGDGKIKTPVSTHSRAKAAAYFIDSLFGVSQCFNTQPREGGCISKILALKNCLSFQHTAARRRLLHFDGANHAACTVSTHSRAKAAATASVSAFCCSLFQHTAARRRLHAGFILPTVLPTVSTHSRAKAAAGDGRHLLDGFGVSTHSRAKAAASDL